MPPPHAYWVIVTDSTPTSFRARYRDDLLPTLRQLQRTQPQTELKWFDGTRLWSTQEEAREAQTMRRRTPSSRGREWRPGGSHKDPKARFEMTRDQKRAKFKRNLIRGPKAKKA